LEVNIAFDDHHAEKQKGLCMLVVCRPAADQGDPKWLYVYAILVATVIAISMARALAFFEATFRSVTQVLD